jgi:hypothetical protein
MRISIANFGITVKGKNKMRKLIQTRGSKILLGHDCKGRKETEGEPEQKDRRTKIHFPLPI